MPKMTVIDIRVTDSEEFKAFCDAAAELARSVEAEAEWLKAIGLRETYEAGENLEEFVEDFHEAVAAALDKAT